MKLIVLITVVFVSFFGVTQNTLSLNNLDDSSVEKKAALSSDSLYNLGNYYYNQNELGKAIWAYESVLKTDPINEDAEFNLNIVNKQLNVIGNPTKGIGSWFNKNFLSLPAGTLYFASILFAFLTALALYIFFIPSSRTVNHISLLLACLFGFIFLSSFTLSLIQKSNQNTNNKAVAIYKTNQLLVNPTLNSEVANIIEEGKQLNIITEQDDWLELQFENQKGWLLKDSVWVY
jgi:hypothetical protein